MSVKRITKFLTSREIDTAAVDRSNSGGLSGISLVQLGFTRLIDRHRTVCLHRDIEC